MTITHPGNAPWAGNGTPFDEAIGRGGVGYQYSIGRMEVTSAQWVEFMNAAFDRPQSEWLPHLQVPTFWGGVATTPTTPGGRRWLTTPQSANMPVGNITWRMAAMLCNWYENGKSLERSAFLNGAYDVSTFGYTGPAGDIFTDQLAHTPGAHYWVPTWDEWLKAVHYDPAKVNEDGSVGGWWTQPNGTNTALVYLPPDQGGQANANFFTPGPYSIPLAAYPGTVSPWGLLDAAGGSSEWLETFESFTDGTRTRMLEGSCRGEYTSWADRLDGHTSDYPSIPDRAWGFRIASSVPSPGGTIALVAAWCWAGGRRRGMRGRRTVCAG
ncbi:MAG: SUMF1/EgtB/PvdO family nonheme iron enzyme [Phycisphaerales bacterium]